MKMKMAQNILSARDLEGFPNQGKVERGDWVGSSVEENRGLPELSSAAKFIGGKTSGIPPENCALHADGVVCTLAIRTEKPCCVCVRGNCVPFPLIITATHLKGQNVLWFPLAQMW